MIAFNVGMPEQSVVLADGKIYATDNLLGSDFSAEFASALATNQLKADSDKSDNSLIAIEGDIAIAELASIPEKSELSDVNISPEGQISSPIPNVIGESDIAPLNPNPLNPTFTSEHIESESELILNSDKVVKNSDVNIGQVKDDIASQNGELITPNSSAMSTKVESKVSLKATEQTLVMNQQAIKIENVEINPQSNPINQSESANTQNTEIGSILTNGTKSEKSTQEPKIIPEINVNPVSKLNTSESTEKSVIQPNTEQKQSNTESKSEKNVVEIISQIIPNKNQNQIFQPTSKLFTNNVVEIPQTNDNVHLKITIDGIINNLANSNQLAPKTEQNTQAQQSLEHLTLLSKGIFSKNLDFATQIPNKTHTANEPTITKLPNAEAAIVGSNQVKNDQQVGILHRIVQNSEYIARNIETSNAKSDDNSPKEEKSNQQSNEKSPATKENTFVNQVKGESHKADSELKLNENIDVTVKLPKQSDNTEISELYNKISPFVQKSNNILVNNHILTDSETPTKEFARVKLSDIPRRIMQLATNQASDGISSAKLVMHPKSLGTIVVHLEIVKNVVKLHLTGEKREALSAVESTIGMLKERLHSKGLVLDNVEYNLNDSNEQANSGKHNQTEKEQKQIKRTYNNEKLSESSDGNDKLHDNKILRHDNGTIVEKYI
ncbi:MAG: flagellar hook-length control protein FliK [Candidatus Kapabacteria bacterium]|nr:flagellar hook-length control protein FliK [Candidatus Kapabacteria bacterium]